MADFNFSPNDDDDFVEPVFTKKKNERQLCVTCGKDISHLDSLRRSEHINRCLDKEEVKSKVDRIQDNYDKTRDCPLCFQPLTPGPHRVTHYKRCAKDHNVTAAEMNELIAHNERVADIRKRSGITHTRARPQSNSELESKIATKMCRKNKIGPKNLVDEHMEMALALSLSENFHFEPPAESSKLKQSGLKQITLPTLLESTSSESRSNLLQERLFQIVLAKNSNDSVAVSEKTMAENGEEIDSKSGRWWRLQAIKDAELDAYKIDIFRKEFSDQIKEDMPGSKTVGTSEAIEDIEMGRMDVDHSDANLEVLKGDLVNNVVDSSIPLVQFSPMEPTATTQNDDSIIILDDDEDELKGPIASVTVPKDNTMDDDSFFKNLPADLSRGWASPSKDSKPVETPEIFATPSNEPDSTASKSNDRILWEEKGIYVIKRNNVTPTPNFKAMNTPMLKTKLKQNGFRICARRKAIRLLTKAYNATHPYLTDRGEIREAEYVETPKCSKKTSGQKNVSKRSVAGKRSGEKKSKNSNGKAVEETELSGSNSDENSDEEMTDNVPEEETMSLLEDDAETGTGSQSVSTDLTAQLLDCFRTNEKLYKRMLRYEPISFKEFHQTVKDAGIRCSATKLLDFLDSQCITFTVKDNDSKKIRVQGRKRRVSKKKNLNSGVKVND